MKKYCFFLFSCIFYLPLNAQVCQTVGNIIREVSVNTNGEPVIVWDVPASLPPNATGYIIYDYLGGTACTQAIIKVSLSTYAYTHAGAVPLTGTRAYSVAIDTDIEPEPITQQHAFSYLQASYDSCRYTINMEWTPYIGWEGANVLYDLYGGTNGGAMSLLIPDITDTHYTLTNVPDNVLYHLYVVAKKTGTSIESASNRVSLSTTTSQRPHYLNINNINFEDNAVSLYFSVDTNTALPVFHITRSHQPDGPFNMIHTFTDKSLQTYVDDAVNKVYYYRLITENYCALEAGQGNLLNNMVLSGEAKNGAWQLSWSALNTIDPVYHLTCLQPPPATLIYTGTNTSYVDIINTSTETLTYCYTLSGTGATGEKSTTKTCMAYEPEIIMPNAIDPKSTRQNSETGRQRNQFGPIVYAHPSSYKYLLEIYNRNGDQIAAIEKAENDNPLDHTWTGTKKDGNYAQEGMYLYRLQLTFTTGETVTQTGSVTVVYN